jgi:hypothetical protein
MEEIMTASSEPVRGPDAARGPLVVSAANPCYFTVASDQRKAVYLTGSHIWNNLRDGMGPVWAAPSPLSRSTTTPTSTSWPSTATTFIRLWRWEQFRSQAAGATSTCAGPHSPGREPARARPTDGKPRFDLDRFDEAFFDWLRDRVVAAGRRGIYVTVMFFDCWALHLSPAPDHVEGHPFHAANASMGSGSARSDYQVLPLDPRVQALQEAYVDPG